MIRKRKNQDNVWGIDRIDGSLSYGELVVHHIYLWSEPKILQWKDGDLDPEKLTGALMHGFPVTVKDSRLADGIMFYFVKANVKHQGKRYPQEGWLPSSLLKERGSKEWATKI